MNFVRSGIKWIMLVAGASTCTMVYAAIAPQAALRVDVRRDAGRAARRDRGAQLGRARSRSSGVMLIWGAFKPQVRTMALVLARRQQARVHRPGARRTAGAISASRRALPLPSIWCGLCCSRGICSARDPPKPDRPTTPQPPGRLAHALRSQRTRSDRRRGRHRHHGPRHRAGVGPGRHARHRLRREAGRRAGREGLHRQDAGRPGARRAACRRPTPRPPSTASSVAKDLADVGQGRRGDRGDRRAAGGQAGAVRQARGARAARMRSSPPTRRRSPSPPSPPSASTPSASAACTSSIRCR